MSNKPSGLSRFWKEVKRRKVLRSLAIYAGTAFVILEAATIIFPRWGLPDWSIDLVLWLLIIGLFINLIIAWMYDITLDGLQKTKATEELDTDAKPSDSRSWKAATYISLVVIVALVLFNVFNPGQTLRAGDIQSLLVLPFDNLTGDDQLDYVAAGMHSSLIGDIGRISSLRIISKTTANMYKKMDMALPDMATEANADVVVEPVVMCYGDSICVQVRVVSPFPEEKQLWIGEYKEEKSQILNLYNRVARQIAKEIKVTLTPDEIEVLSEIRTVNTEAYDLYMRGMYYWDQLTPEALQMALEYYNKAIEVDPDWALPYLGVAEFWIGVRQMGLAPHEITVPNIYKFLNKGMELDPNSARAHYTNAVTAVWTGYEWAKGEQELLKVLEMNPNDAYARAYYAHLLLFLKRPEEAVKQADKALELDPLNFLIQGLAAIVYMHAGDYEKAMMEANKVLSIVPNHPLGLTVMWVWHYQNENHREAVKYCAMMFGMKEEIMIQVLETQETQGYEAALKEILSVIQSIPEEQVPVSASIRIAWLHMFTGEINEALTIIEEVLAGQDPDLPYVFTGSDMYKEMHNNPRYLAVQEKMGLPPLAKQ